ncbi:MAG: hypothetical protein KC416_15920, partial [Myxococcales bacterium]|nr:hypothetical protein [Myxococcales bacterium]
MTRITLGLGFLVAIAVVAVFIWRSGGPDTTAPTVDDPSPPASEDHSKEGIRMSLTIHDEPDRLGKGLELGLDEGTAWLRIDLDLLNRLGQERGSSLVMGTLESSSVEEGGRFVEALADALEVDAPEPTEGGELRPFRILAFRTPLSSQPKYVFAFEHDENIHFNLVLDQAGHAAYLSGVRKPDLTLRRMAEALRDGQPPLRTVENDPNYKSDMPLVPSPIRLPGKTRHL